MIKAFSSAQAVIKIEISFAKAIPAPRRKGTLIAPNAESIILATYIATVITPGSAT